MLRHMNHPIRVEKGAQAMPLTGNFRGTVRARRGVIDVLQAETGVHLS
jgi:hypothetical protein